MPRSIDLIRASKLPSNMMQFAAKGALSVPPEETIEILVYLAKHNKVFGDLARMTLAGWDEKASMAAAADPKTPREVLDYLISPDNVRPRLLPALLANPSVADGEIAKFAVSASQDSIALMLQSTRVRLSARILDSLRSNPYLKREDGAVVAELLNSVNPAQTQATQTKPTQTTPAALAEQEVEPAGEAIAASPASSVSKDAAQNETIGDELASAAESENAEIPDDTITAYLAEHAAEIEQENDKPFQPVGGIVDLLGANYFPVSENRDMAEIGEPSETAAAPASQPAKAPVRQPAATAGVRDNSVQKINRLDVKGRIQLAMKGNKEERSILIRDGSKVVALAVLDAPKLSDGEVEKFALQKNVLEAVLRHIPLKRRFMKNYIVVRNLVSNPRTPLDLSLGLMKHLLSQDLKNISGNKEISETVRKLALKMYQQKVQTANKK